MQISHCEKATFLFFGTISRSIKICKFFRTFALQAFVSTSHDGCAKRCLINKTQIITILNAKYYCSVRLVR